MVTSNASSAAAATTSAAPLLFDDIAQLVDAVMLFGAAMRPCSEGSNLAIISVKRHQPQWPSLAWLMITLERTDPLSLRFNQTITYGRFGLIMTCVTRGSRFLLPQWRRWYATRDGKTRATMPEGIVLDDRMLTFWMVGSVVRSRDDGHLILDAPGMSESVTHHLADQIPGRVEWKIQCAPFRGSWAIYIPKAARDQAEQWLERFVPRSVWFLQKPKG